MILDTNALSALADGQPEAARVSQRAASVELPVIVVGEFRFGIAQSRHRTEYEQWFDEFHAASRILDLDSETANCYAAIRLELKAAGTPIPSNDAWIAALARQHALPVLTRDRHFDLVRGLRRIGW